VQSLLSGGNCPVAPSLAAGLVILQLFQNASLELQGDFPYLFPVFGAVMPLKVKTLSELIVLATSQGAVVCSQLQLNFLFFSDTSLLTLIFC